MRTPMVPRLKLTGAKAEIADKMVREIATRLQF